MQIILHDPKFSDRQNWTNSVDPDQTSPEGVVCTDSTLFFHSVYLLATIILW